MFAIGGPELVIILVLILPLTLSIYNLKWNSVPLALTEVAYVVLGLIWVNGHSPYSDRMAMLGQGVA